MRKVPLIGFNVSLDFIKPLIKTGDNDQITKAIINGFSSKFKQNASVQNTLKINNISTIFFTFEKGYLTVSSHEEEDIISVDLKFLGQGNDGDINDYEELLCDLFGWENNTGNNNYFRGDCEYHLQNRYSHSETIYKNFRLIHREQTKYQDLRIYDTQDMGRVLTLDRMIQNTDSLSVDSYTIDLSSLVVKKDKEYNHILLIGAGDLIIPDYILKNFNVKKITLVEIDDRVIENTKKYFKFYNDSVSKFIEAGRLELIVDDGAKYLRDRQSEGELFDGIIIDNSDVYLFDGPAANLFTKEFYQSIKATLKKGAFFSQQVSEEKVKQKWTEIVKSVGFNTIDYLYSQTPEYSTALPLGCAMKE